MNEEIQALQTYGTWELQDLPKGRKAIKCKWVFKIKRNADGTVARYKARLVACGYSQEKGIDYHETFAPVVRMESIRVCLAVASALNMVTKQMDVSNAFLNGTLDEEIYMRQPEGYLNKHSPHSVCRLRKSLYGCKQAQRVWNESFNNTMELIGFRRCMYDQCVYVRG